MVSGEPLRWGDSAVVKERGLGGLPHERVPKGFPDRLEATVVGFADSPGSGEPEGLVLKTNN